jgi:predicted ATPase/transcriptional regulator with XRE-family HTH domain
MGGEGKAGRSSDLGMLLRRYRIGAGLTQDALAERAGMTAGGIRLIERGDRRAPQDRTMTRLIEALSLNHEQRRALETAAAHGRTARRPRSAPNTHDTWLGAPRPFLPVAITSFVGRELELDQISSLLNKHRMVTVTGPGGIGKTQTAMRVGAALTQKLPVAAYFVSLAPIGNPSLVATVVASAIGVQEVQHRTLTETLVAFLKNKMLLLLLDNCEHVAAETASISQTLLRHCPNIRILATSRVPLRSGGERTYRLLPLKFPGSDVAHLRASEAVAYSAVLLFADRAKAVDHRFKLTNENASSIGEICQRLDGIPLAIELAAARTSVLSAHALAESLSDRLRMLTAGERTAPQRQKTMRATIDWSYGLLSEPEQRLFERLAMFAGGCTLSAAENVCGDERVAKDDVLQFLASLVDKSLLLADLDAPSPRYRLLEPFRQYAHERLVAREEDQIIARRHAIGCRDLAVRVAAAAQCEPFKALRALTFGEQDNIRTALEWSLGSKHDILLGQQLVAEVVLASFLPYSEARRWVTVALEAAGEETPPSVIAFLKLSEARCAGNSFDYAAELLSAEEALAYYREHDDLRSRTIALLAKGDALYWLRRREEATEVLEEAVDLTRQLGNRGRLWLATTLRSLARAATDATATRTYNAEAVQVFSQLADPEQTAVTLVSLSICELQAGNLDSALKHTTKATAITSVRPHVRASLLGWHSHNLLECGRFDEAATALREPLQIAREHSLGAHFLAWILDVFVGVAVLRAPVLPESILDVYSNAARLLGFVEARLSIKYTSRDVERLHFDRVLEKLRAELGRDRLSELTGAGARLGEDEAVELAQALLGRSASRRGSGSSAS